MRVRLHGDEEVRRIGRVLHSVQPRRVVVTAAARELRGGSPAVERAIRVAALRRLPKSGGLAALVAGSPIDTDVKVTGDTATVTLRSRRWGEVDDGVVFHQVYGRGRPVAQPVSPGFFTQGGMPEAERQLDGAGDAGCDAAVSRIVNG